MKNRKEVVKLDLLITLGAAFVLSIIVWVIWTAGDD